MNKFLLYFMLVCALVNYLLGHLGACIFDMLMAIFNLLMIPTIEDKNGKV